LERPSLSTGIAPKAIGSITPELSESGWVRIKRGMYGVDIWARQIGQSSLDGVNPLRLAAEGSRTPSET